MTFSSDEGKQRDNKIRCHRYHDKRRQEKKREHKGRNSFEHVRNDDEFCFVGVRFVDTEISAGQLGVWVMIVGRTPFPSPLCTGVMSINRLHGERDLEDARKVTNYLTLKIGKLSWIIQVGPIKSHKPLKAELSSGWESRKSQRSGRSGQWKDSKRHHPWLEMKRAACQGNGNFTPTTTKN